jgi:hypothetical protein
MELWGEEIGARVILWVLIGLIEILILLLAAKTWKLQRGTGGKALVLGVTILLAAQVIWVITDTRVCPESKATFQYAGCSVTYNKIDNNWFCRPCGGLKMCPAGIGKNQKIEILGCLCGEGKKAEAVNFRKEYLDETTSNACINIPKKEEFDKN